MKILRKVLELIKKPFKFILRKPNFKSKYFWLVIAGLGFYAFKYYRKNSFIGTQGRDSNQSLLKNIWQVFGYWVAEKWSAIRDLCAIILRKKDAQMVLWDAQTNEHCDKIKYFFGVYIKES